MRIVVFREFIHQVVTGYLPSVILILFLYAVPPTMMLFSAIEGNISRSQRKWGACIKVLLPSSRLTYYHQAGLACPVK
ncbi:hypothetical protein GOBAR_DD21914 [Gossypium barbadense]|nr:hypothetical protein GOBAR_DD21914 [Gossypium barbadense]